MSFYKVKYKIHMLTAALLLCTPTFILPNLSTDLSNYVKLQKVFSYAFIIETEYRNIFSKDKIEQDFLMVMTDSTRWYVASGDKKYWPDILNPDNANKNVTMYISNNSEKNFPVQLEINDKIIFGVNEQMPAKYFLLFITIGLSIYSLIDVISFLKHG